MTDGDAKRAGAAAAEKQANAAQKQADVAERRENREKFTGTVRDVGSGIGNFMKGLTLGKGFSLHNDARWYMNYPDAKYFGKASFKVIGGPAQSAALNGGLQIIHYLPAFDEGVAGASDAITKALLAIQQDVRMSNSGAKNYEPSDIAMMVIATGEILALYGELARAYAVLNDDSSSTQWLKEVFISAYSGQSYLDASEEAVQLYATFQRVKSLMATVHIPHFAWFDRIWHLAVNVFKDSKLKRSKYIAFMRDAFGIIQNSGTYLDQRGNKVHYQPVLFGANTGSFTGDVAFTDLEGARKYLLMLVTALTNVTDYVTIMGDLAKAFGAEMFLPQVPVDLKPNIIDDDVTLTQIDNTRLLGRSIWLGADTSEKPADHGYGSLYDVNDASGTLMQGLFTQTSATQDVIIPPLFNPTTSSTSIINDGAIYVDSPKDDPTEEDMYVLTRNLALAVHSGQLNNVMQPLLASANREEATFAKAPLFHLGAFSLPVRGRNGSITNRWRTIDGVADTANHAVYAKQHGSEYFTYVEYFMMGADSIVYTNVAAWIRQGETSPSYAGTVAVYNHHPQVFTGISGSFTSFPILTGIYDNTIKITEEFLANINYASMFSLFSIAGGGTNTDAAPRRKGKARK